MTLSNKTPASSKKIKNKLSGAIKSLLPRCDGRCAYDSGWDDAFDPIEYLASGNQDNIHKPSVGQTEQDSHRSADDIPQLTLAQVRQAMLHAAGKKGTDDASPTQPPQPLRLNLNTAATLTPLPALPRPAPDNPHASPDDDDASADTNEDSSTCPSPSGSSASLQLDGASEYSCCTLDRVSITL